MARDPNDRSHERGEDHARKAYDEADSAKPGRRKNGLDEDPWADPALPQIQITADLKGLLDELQQALLDAKTPIFQRGGELVELMFDAPLRTDKRQTVKAQLVSLQPQVANMHINAACRLARYKERERKWMPLQKPPADITELLLQSQAHWHKVRRITGIIHCQSLRPDGSVLGTAGYDPATELLLHDPPAMPEVPDRPTKAQAYAALRILDELINGFPFVTEADRSVALAAIMGAVLRPAMDVAPMICVSAPTPSTGKTYLINLASIIATGRDCPTITPHERDDELEKRLGACYLGGLTQLNVDNIEHPLGGAAVAQMVTSERINVRVLGLSKIIEFVNRMQLFGTGNNLLVRDDVVRRVLVCRIDARIEKPELRNFQSDPVAAALANRGLYVHAVLVLVKWFLNALAAGEAELCPPLGNFEAWNRLVRSPLVALDLQDPLLTQDVSRAQDPVITELGAILANWPFPLDEHEMRATTELINAAALTPNAEFRVALSFAVKNGQLNDRILGRRLSKYAGRIVDGRRIEREMDRHTKTVRYRVVSVAVD